MNDGFEGVAKQIELSPGTRIDRYGFETGTFVSPEGIPYGQLSLAPGTELKQYHVYEVVNITRSIIIPLMHSMKLITIIFQRA